MVFNERVFNFSAGPCAMPTEVLERVQADLLNHKGAGCSVMEMSHRSKEFVNIAAEAEADLRDILSVPSTHKIFFQQGGATLQFAGVPLNLLGQGNTKADYLVTGQWGDKASKEATKYGDIVRGMDTKDTKYTTIAAPDTWKLRDDAAYVHYCANETVNGVEFQYVPDVKVPLVGDLSSNFMSKPIDFSKHAVIYAGAQKNLGPAGNVVLIADEKFVGREQKICPGYLSWKTTIDADSMHNTPSCFAIYVMGEYLKYTKQKGGIQYWNELSEKKSTMLYNVIDDSDGFYTGPVAKDCRSRMNVPFQIQKGNDALEKKFLEDAKKNGLTTLAGHRTVGGIRASLYNGMPLEGVQKLIEFMKAFAQENAQ